MVLPTRLRIQLRARGEPLPSLSELLISLRTFVAGRPYYGTLLGLTDANGQLDRAAGELEAEFHAAQTAYPMDYRVPLSGCDPEIEIVVHGGRAFAEYQAEVKQAAHVDPDARALWRRARNGGVLPASLRVDLRAAPELLSIPVEIR